MSGDPRYIQLLEDMKTIHLKKSADYGKGEDPLANLRASEAIGIPAFKGAWLRARDKIHRIDAYCVNGNLANEGVEDSLMDLAAYSLLVLILHREASKNGV